MKAIIHERFGSPDGLVLKEIAKPEPKDNEILLKVHATSVNAYDWRHVRADPFLLRLMGGGLFKPKHPILGADIAGVVEKVGSGIKDFKPGDEVFGEGGYGGFAEYVCVTEKGFVLKPSKISFAEAAAAPMATLTALQGLRDQGKINNEKKVLINGASGGVGSFAVQIAKSYGATVTGVCSTSKMEMVLSIGADYVIDYTKEDVTQKGQKYDLILDIAAYRSVSEFKKIMEPEGNYLIAGGSISKIFSTMFKTMLGSKNLAVVMAKIEKQDMQIISDLLETGKIRSIIHKTFPLEETAKAISLLEDGKVKGKVVISLLE